MAFEQPTACEGSDVNMPDATVNVLKADLDSDADV
jgi:hypothetical protein